MRPCALAACLCCGRRLAWGLALLAALLCCAGAAAQAKKQAKSSEKTAIEIVVPGVGVINADRRAGAKGRIIEAQGGLAGRKKQFSIPPKSGGIVAAPSQAPGGAVKPGAGDNTAGPAAPRDESSAAANIADVLGKQGAVAPLGETGPSAGGSAAAPGDSGAAPKDLPGFAEEQPGFIPDTKPEDLFARPGGGQEPTFNSALEQSKLTDQTVAEVIAAQEQLPGEDLPENFARVVVPNGTITGSTESKQFHIEGGLIVYYSNVTITGDSADIDEKNEIAVIKSNVTINDPKYSLRTDELRILFGEKRFEATGFVQFKKVTDETKSAPNMALAKKERLREYFSGQQLDLFCNKLFYNWETKEMTASESVQMVHPFFTGTMERLEYNDESKQYGMTGGVLLEISDYSWIFATKMADDKDEPRLRAITDGPTTVTCERMNYSDETNVAEFYAKTGELVSFEQPKRGVKANYIEINDKTKDFYAEGTAEAPATYTQLDGEWLYNAELIKKDSAPKEVNDMLSAVLEAKAKSITYNFDRRRMELREGVNIKGQGSEVTAHELVQDETAKFFLLSGNVTIISGEDSQVYAAQVYVDTENDVITFVGMVQGTAKSAELAAMGPQKDEKDQAGQGGQGVAGGTIQPGVFGDTGGTTRNGANVAEKK